MKAIVVRRHGFPEQVLALHTITTPSPKPGEILVRVMASSFNPVDEGFILGCRQQTQKRCKFPCIVGTDLAGIVVGVGRGCTRMRLGDKVFAHTGLSLGAFAEYARVLEDHVDLMPEKTTFQEAACLPWASVAAFKLLVHHGKIRAGKRVLILGGGTGCGAVSIMLGKGLRARVTCTVNVLDQHYASSLGADEVSQPFCFLSRMSIFVNASCARV